MSEGSFERSVVSAPFGKPVSDLGPWVRGNLAGFRRAPQTGKASV